jgi:hypothetical protein
MDNWFYVLLNTKVDRGERFKLLGEISLDVHARDFGFFCLEHHA